MKQYKAYKSCFALNIGLNLMMVELNINYSQALNLAPNSFFAQQNKDEKYIKTILKNLVKSLDK